MIIRTTVEERERAVPRWEVTYECRHGADRFEMSVRVGALDEVQAGRAVEAIHTARNMEGLGVFERILAVRRVPE